MGLEVAVNFNELNPLFPLATDARSEGDDHLRMLKICLQTVFPGMAGRFGRVQAKATAYTLLATDNQTILNCTAALTVTGLAVATAGNGFAFGIYASGGDVTFDPAGAETVNEVASVVVRKGHYAMVFTNATGWFLIAFAVAEEQPSGGFKNKIIGGDFTTNPWQRGATFTAPASGTYTADRFAVVHSTDGVVDVLKTADGPTASETGLFSQHCLHLDVTTADAAIAAGQYYLIQHKIEGLNAASFGFGQTGVRYVTLSFWHKHTKTGTYCVAFKNSAADRNYIAEYTQAVTDTWEKAIITIPVDITGTWLYTNGVGLVVSFAAAVGSTFQGTVSAWQAGNLFATANQVNALDSVANNFKIDLVQLEAGQVATKFEVLDVGTVLLLCQRYYHRDQAVSATHLFGQSGFAASATEGSALGKFPATMRTAPTALEQSGTASQYTMQTGGVNRVCSSVLTYSASTTANCWNITTTVASGQTAGLAGFLYGNSTSAYLGWSAEL